MHPQQPNDNPSQARDQEPIDYSKPVAYDNEGRPLYAHPPASAKAADSTPQMVYLARPHSPEKPQIPDSVIQKHEESKRKYPHLNLSYGEYIISAVKRHPVGLVKIWSFVVTLILVFGAVITMLISAAADDGAALGGLSQASVSSLGLAVMIVVSVLGLIGGFVASYVYNANRFYLTNESVIQLIQTSLFSLHEQTVSLANIEDASYEQHGIMPQLLNYGRIRLSTEGDETTYRFAYVSNPKKEIAVLNNAVEAFKNGRPISED